MEKMTTQMYTVFLLMGPSNCGKTTFSRILKDKLHSYMKDSGEPARINYVSSDALRCEILGQDLHKYDDLMTTVSPFDLLYKKLEVMTSYPANNHFVILDSTGLQEEFRDKVKQICEKNQYTLQLVVFDYPRDDYFWDGMTATEKRVTGKHVDFFKRVEVARISKMRQTRFKQRVSDFDLNISDYGMFKKTYFTPEKPVAAIQDIHGCIDELKDLLLKMGVGINQDGKITKSPYSLVIIGDYIDKGKFSKEVVRFLYNNKEWFSIIIGNHEKFVVNYLKGEKSYLNTDPSVVKDNFDSVYILDDVEKNMLYELFSNSIAFYKTKHFILTHAPCEDKYLGKLDQASVKKQINTGFMKREKDFGSEYEYVEYLEKTYSYLQESRHSNPLHVFGHQTFKRVLKAPGKMGIDTGCYAGGHLSAVILDGKNTKVVFVKAKQVYKQANLLNIFEKKEELNEDESYRAKQIANNKVNFVSGTVSPSAQTNDCLESLNSAFEYYRSKGVNKLMLQKKYMGSRCNIYLSLDEKECFAVTRNGYRVKKDLSEVYKKLILEHKDDMIIRKVKMKILDGEIMPWSFLGKGLIESRFKVISKSVKEEISLLEISGFEEGFNQLQKKMEDSGFKKKINVLKKDDVIKEFGKSNYDSMTVALQTKNFSLELMKKMIETYDRQLELYAQESSPFYLPFALVKEVFEDGSEKVYISSEEKTEDNFKKVSSDSYFIVDINDISSVEKAQEFYKSITLAQGCEGAMVKTEYTYHPGICPMIKVRNSDYLSIIYGYDYLLKEKLEKLIENKSTSGKMKSSIKEYSLMKRMLEIPFSELNEDNKKYMTLIEEVVREETKEMSYDPRL